MVKLYYFLFLVLSSICPSRTLAQSTDIFKFLNSLEFGTPFAQIENVLGKEYKVSRDIWLSDCGNKMSSGYMITYPKLGIAFSLNQTYDNSPEGHIMSLLCSYINPAKSPEKIYTGIDLTKIKTIQSIVDRFKLPGSIGLYLTMDNRVRIAFPIQGYLTALSSPLPLRLFQDRYVRVLPKISIAKNQKGGLAYANVSCATTVSEAESIKKFAKEFTNTPIEFILVDKPMGVIELQNYER